MSPAKDFAHGHTPANSRWLADLPAGGERQRTALEELRRRLLRGLKAAFARRGIDESLLEDAVQEALVTILGRLDTFRGDSRFLTWAMSIASRVVWTELRRRRWRDVSLDELLAPEGAYPPRRSGLESARTGDREPEQTAEQAALLGHLRRLIEAELTERQRTALQAELSGMPQQEIARRLGSNPNAVYKLVHDARRRLKRELEKAGYSSADVLSAFDH